MQPRPYVLAGAAVLVAAVVLRGSLGALLAVAGLMLLAQALLLHRSRTSGLPAERERLRGLLVGDVVEVGDAPTALPAADASADGALSVLRMGRLDDVDAREAAARELARVVRPGGRVALLEARGTQDLALALEDLGFTEVERSGRRWSVWPPPRAITARRAER